MDLLDKAICFAVEKHSGQVRKRLNSPYILHPLEVVSIAGTMTNDEFTLAAAALHDTVEDAGVTFEEIKQNFGIRVLELVKTETENKREDLPPEDTWQIRKQESLEVLKNTQDIFVKILWLSDKLSNMRSFYRAYLLHGNTFWNDFNQKDTKMQAWYYSSIAQFTKELKQYDAYNEYVRLMNIVFEEK